MILPSSVREYNERLQFLRQEISAHLKDLKIQADVNERLKLVSDIQKFRQEIQFISDQAKRKIPTTYHIYWDGEWVCRFNSMHSPGKIMYAFWSGLWGLVTDGKVFLKQEEMEMQEAIEKALRTQKVAKKRRRKQELLDKPLDPIVKEAVASLEGL